jgi:hypothetical protein
MAACCSAIASPYWLVVDGDQRGVVRALGAQVRGVGDVLDADGLRGLDRVEVLLTTARSDQHGRDEQQPVTAAERLGGLRQVVEVGLADLHAPLGPVRDPGHVPAGEDQLVRRDLRQDDLRDGAAEVPVHTGDHVHVLPLHLRLDARAGADP